MDSDWLHRDENRTGYNLMSSELAENKKSETESGYIIAMTALLLVPMIVLAAFAVDVGSWYADSARLQRAADAAALAAVVYMPSDSVAHAKAIEVAAQNGFISDIDENGAAVPGGNSTLTFVGDGASVNIRIDYKGELFFGKAFLSDVDLARTANAEFIEPVRMGNPTSALGTGNLDDPSDVGDPAKADGFWLAINHHCQYLRNGDPFVQYVNGCTSGGAVPIGALPVAQGGAGWSGYVFVVDMPAAATGTAVIEIRDPGWCANKDGVYGSAEPDIEAFVYNPDGDLFSSNNLSQVANLHVPWDADNQGSNCGWQTIDTITATGSRALWYVKLRPQNEPDDVWINTFSLRVRKTSAAANAPICDSSTVTPNTCPSLYALDWLPIYRPDFKNPDGTTIETAEFFLADIPAYHDGKMLELTLFDPGEGMKEIRILNPDGNQPYFDYREAQQSVLGLGADASWKPADSGVCVQGPYCLNVDSPYAKFNSDAVQIRVPLTSYSCQTLATGENCWWKVQYYTESSSGVTDRTTWKVRIIGDPIRLTE